VWLATERRYCTHNGGGSLQTRTPLFRSQPIELRESHDGGVDGQWKAHAGTPLVAYSSRRSPTAGQVDGGAGERSVLAAAVDGGAYGFRRGRVAQLPPSIGDRPRDGRWSRRRRSSRPPGAGADSEATAEATSHMLQTAASSVALCSVGPTHEGISAIPKHGVPEAQGAEGCCNHCSTLPLETASMMEAVSGGSVPGRGGEVSVGWLTRARRSTLPPPRGHKAKSMMHRHWGGHHMIDPRGASSRAAQTASDAGHGHLCMGAGGTPPQVVTRDCRGLQQEIVCRRPPRCRLVVASGVATASASGGPHHRVGRRWVV